MMTRMWNTMLFNLNNENIGKGRYYNGIHNRVYVLEKRTKAITSTTTIGRMMDTIDIHHQRMRTTIKTKIFSVIPRWGRIAVPRTTTAISLTLRYFGRRRRRITHTRHASLIMDQNGIENLVNCEWRINRYYSSMTTTRVAIIQESIMITFLRQIEHSICE